jgi:hypothetical protein
MFFDDATVASGDSRDLVQEAINNAQADLVKSQSTLHNIAFQESISDPCPSPESKKKCVITADSSENADDDPLLHSFYERDWRMKKSPPLPIKEWASMFPHLMLLNDDEESMGTWTRNDQQTSLKKEDKSESAQMNRSELRSKLKKRLQMELLS